MVGPQAGIMGILLKHTHSGRAAGTVWGTLKTKDNAGFDWQGVFQGRALPVDTPCSPDLLIGQILSLIDPPDRPFDISEVSEVFNALCRTNATNTDASFEILSLLRRRPSFSTKAGTFFT